MKLNRTRLAWTLTIVSLVGGTAFTLTSGYDGAVGTLNSASAAETRKPAGIESAEESSFKATNSATSGAAESATTEAAHPAANNGAALPRGGACIVDQAAVEDLQRQRGALDARQKDLAARESELKNLEKSVGDELKQLEQVRIDMQKIEAMKKSENEEKVARIVETLQTMSPKAAAQLLTTIEDALAVTAISRMDTLRLAKIMNVMDTGRASRLTELLAGVVRANKPVAVAQVEKSARAGTTRSTASASYGADRTTNSTKGGEKYDGQSQSQQQQQPSHAN